MKPNIYSEIDKLKSVIVHRPGEELNNLTPDFMEELLFDELPYLENAIREHDFFCETMRNEGIEVLYLEDLAAESIKQDDVRKQFIEDFLEESGNKSADEINLLRDLLTNISDEKELILKTMAGVRLDEIGINDESGRLLAVNPMPNLYFTRDPFSFVGNCVSINRMWSKTRNRETLYAKYIFTYNSRFNDIEKIYDRTEDTSIEGGDILILNSECVAVGISQRTQKESVDKFAKNLLEKSDFKFVLSFKIPNKREFMHLDTVFTMIDKGIFTVHPLIEGPLYVEKLYLEDNTLQREVQKGSLEDILSTNLHVDNVKIIRCGGTNPIDQMREQWNDGSNTLAIAPNTVIVYDRNNVTNSLLQEADVNIRTIKSGELSRGRGGPRCMSMPFEREM